MSFKMQRPVVDLPQPDSPTMPRVLPSSKEKLTPSTAWSWPAAVLKYLVKFSITNKGALLIFGSSLKRSQV